MNPYVKRVRPLEDYQLELIFENGEQRIFDVKPYLQRGVFVRLQNRATFQAVRASSRFRGVARRVRIPEL